MVEMICSKCNINKNESEFELRKDTGKFRKQCQQCRKSKINQWYIKNKENFSEHRKKYMKKYNVEYREKNRDELNKYSKNYNLENKERLTEYYKQYNHKNKDKIYLQRKEYFQKYQQENNDRFREYRKQWRKDNPDKIKLYVSTHINKNPQYISNMKIWMKNYSKEYRIKNKESILKNKRKYETNRRAEDINFKVTKNLRTRIYSVLKGINKSESTMELIGCTIEELKKHLEKTFTVDMNWDNYGSLWSVDHVIPCAIFDLTKIEEQQRCFNYRNLQALNAIENSSKQHKIRFKDIVF